MTEAQANPQGLMTIGAVAAHNIAAILNLPDEHVGTIEQAIKDEIGAMSTHFTLAIADVATQHEVAEAALKKECETIVATVKAKLEAEVAEFKSTFTFVNANKAVIAVAVIGLLSLGALAGHLV